MLQIDVPGQADGSNGAVQVQDVRGHDEIKNDGPVGGQTLRKRQFRAGSIKKKMTSSVLMKTSFVLMCVMIMETHRMLMPERTGSLMPRTRSVLVCPMMMTDTCPTGGLYNILRFAKSVVGMLFQEFQSLWEEDEESISSGGQEGGDDQGDVHVQAPIDEGGGTVLV